MIMIISKYSYMGVSDQITVISEIEADGGRTETVIVPEDVTVAVAGTGTGVQFTPVMME